MGLYRPSYKKAGGGLKKSRVWWLEFTRDGKRHRVNLGARDRRAAELKAGELLRKAELRAAGIADPFEEQRERPLDAHLADFETALRAKGVTAGHLADRMGDLRAYVAAAHVRTIAALDGTAASAWLTTERERGLSAKAINEKRGALRQFTRWLVRERRIGFDPFVSLPSLNVEADRRHVRRALKPEELARLLDAARRRPLEAASAPRTIRGNVGVTPVLSAGEEARLRALGETRAIVYDLAAGTGLRNGELRRLRWQDVDLERGRVNVPAASAKSRKDQWVPLRSDLVAALAARRGNASASDAVLRSEGFPTLRTFKLDLAAAGIPLRDEQGRVVDFHALRVSFVSGLAAAGVHPRVAQALARHSTVELTMKAYTDVSVLDLKGAVEQLAPHPKAGSGDPNKPGVKLGGPTVTSTDEKGLTRTSENPSGEVADETAPSGNTGGAATFVTAPPDSPGRTRTYNLVVNSPTSQSATPVLADRFGGPLAGLGRNQGDPAELARQLLDLAAEAPNPTPLVEAARELLRMRMASTGGQDRLESRPPT